VTDHQGGTRATSFGEVAHDYGAYRLGPPAVVVDWLLPARVGTAVDLGAGTGAMSAELAERAANVVAVEPDARMRSILRARVPGIRVLDGRGESMPLPGGCADAVVASSSWHWMEPVATLGEVARVLMPGGVLGVVWAGPDPGSSFLAQARGLLAAQPGSGPAGGGDGLGEGEFSELIQGEGNVPSMVLGIPPGAPFEQPEHETFTWDVPLAADDLIGLLGTFSWVIAMDQAARTRLLTRARGLLRELLGDEGEVTADVGFRAEAWRCHRR
jgi:SAM-dependent methyltransferase